MASEDDLGELVFEVVVEEFARLLGMNPEDNAGGARQDTSAEECPGGGFSGPGSVRSAVVSYAREPGSGETRELAATVTPGMRAAVSRAGR
jgi:hypothetical protein